MKKPKKENRPGEGKTNQAEAKTPAEKNSWGKKGTELFRNGTAPNEDGKPITKKDDYRLRANRTGSMDQESRGNKAKEGKPGSNRKKTESVQAEMRIRSGNDEEKMREKL